MREASRRPDPGVVDAGVVGSEMSASDDRLILDLREKVERLTAERDAIAERDQRWVEEVCHYRNLAISLGAKPSDMLHEHDRALCERGVDAGLAPGDWSVADSRAETAELWEQVESLERALGAAEAEAARLLRVADDQHVKHMKALAEVARLREALGACAANIEETGEWGMDALAKTRAALTPTTWEPGT